MFILTLAAIKGGVGKTTAATNMTDVFHGLGLRALLVDGDTRSSLSKVYPLSHMADAGLPYMIGAGLLDEACLSTIDLPCANYGKEPQSPIRLVISDLAGRVASGCHYLSHQLPTSHAAAACDEDPPVPNVQFVGETPTDVQ